jgi:hypothetical protein
MSVDTARDIIIDALKEIGAIGLEESGVLTLGRA